MKELIIKAIKVSNGYFISHGSYATQLISSYKFDGVVPVETFNSQWAYVPSIENCVFVNQEKNIRKGFRLKDNVIPTEELPKEVTEEELGKYDMENYDSTNRAFYDPIYETIPSFEEPCDVNATVLLECPEIENVKDFVYKVRNAIYPNSQPGRTISSYNVINQEIDKIVFPTPVLAVRPSQLSSVDSYEIIRNYIKDNIDPKVAVITSDYDFCLTVQKRIPLAEKQKYTYDANLNFFSNRKRKPKIVTDFKVERKMTCFECAPLKDGKVYNGYTRCVEFEGNSWEDLQNNINSYLEELIKEINKPIIDCDKCKGCGVLLQ